MSKRSLIEVISAALDDISIQLPMDIDRDKSSVIIPSIEISLRTPYCLVSITKTGDDTYVVGERDDDGSLLNLLSFSEDECYKYLTYGIKLRYVASKIEESSYVSRVVTGPMFWEIHSKQGKHMLIESEWENIYGYHLTYYDSDSDSYKHQQQWAIYGRGIEGLNAIIGFIKESI